MIWLESGNYDSYYLYFVVSGLLLKLDFLWSVLQWVSNTFSFSSYVRSAVLNLRKFQSPLYFCDITALEDLYRSGNTCITIAINKLSETVSFACLMLLFQLWTFSSTALFRVVNSQFRGITRGFEVPRWFSRRIWSDFLPSSFASRIIEPDALSSRHITRVENIAAFFHRMQLVCSHQALVETPRGAVRRFPRSGFNSA